MHTIPSEIKNNRFYVEVRDDGSWVLFKRQEIIDPKEFKNMMDTDDSFAHSLLSNEGHPWNLGGGILNTYEHAVDLHTSKFLEFLVESLNKNSTPFGK